MSIISPSSGVPDFHKISYYLPDIMISSKIANAPDPGYDIIFDELEGGFVFDFSGVFVKDSIFCAQKLSPNVTTHG